MYKQLTTQSEIDELVSSYFNRVGKTYMLKALKGFLEDDGFGIGEYGCLFSAYYEPHEVDEDYYIGPNKVCFVGENPAYKEDVQAILDYDRFYKYLDLYCDDYIKNNSGEAHEVEYYLESIKKKLNIE